MSFLFLLRIFTISGLFIVSYAARWIDIIDRVNENMRSVVNLKRASSISAREIVGAGEGEDLEETDQAETMEGENITRYQETYKGIPVYDAYVTLDVDKNTGSYTGRASGNVLGDISDDVTSVVPLLSNSEAIEIAKAKLNDNSVFKYSNEKCRLIIYMNGTHAILSYEVSFLITFERGIQRPLFIINANSGNVIKLRNRATSFSYASVGGNEKVGKYKYGEDMPYLEVEKEGGKCILESKNVKVLNLQNKDEPGSATPFTFDCQKGFNDAVNGAYSQLSDAFFFAENVFKMYENWIRIPPVREKPMIIWVHKGQNAIEAFWSGEYIAFGDGNPVYIYPLVSADVLAHELAHAFTEDHSNLLYNFQSGGINEAFSDITGEAFEYFIRGNVDYLAGGDVAKMGGTRNLCDQSADGYSITHVDDYSDDLDVHYTSGVYNKVACLMSKSNEYNIKTTFQVFAHANRFYWHEESNYEEAACGLVKAAYDLGYETEAVYSALSPVGIDACAIDDHVRMLTEGTILGNLSGQNGQILIFKLDLSRVPIGKNLQVLTMGGSGDVDIYVNRRASLRKKKAKLSSRRKGSNLEILNIPKRMFRKGYCFLFLVPNQSFFEDVTLTTSIIP